VRIRTVSNTKEIAELTHRIPRQTLRRWAAFSGDQRYLAESNLDGVRVWHLAAASEKKVLAGHTEAIPTIDFHPSGKQFATGSKDRKVAYWDLATGQQAHGFPCDGDVQSVRFRGDGSLFAVAHWGGENRDVLVFDARTRALVARAKHSLGHINRITFAGPDHLAASGHTGIVIWDLRGRDIDGRGTPADIHPLKSQEGLQCRDIAASTDGSTLVWSDKPADREGIHVWRWQSGDAPFRLAAPPMLQGWHGLAISPNGKEIIFVANSGRAEIWNLETQTLVAPIGAEGEFQSPHIALTGDGRLLAGLRQSNAVSVWDLDTNRLLFAFPPERAAIWSLAWSPDASHLVVGLNDGGLLVWDVNAVNRRLTQLGLGATAIAD
jgi:WD40 repeat protein